MEPSLEHVHRDTVQTGWVSWGMEVMVEVCEESGQKMNGVHQLLAAALEPQQIKMNDRTVVLTRQEVSGQKKRIAAVCS